MLWCVLPMFFPANAICEHLGYCVVVEYVCVVCGVCTSFVSVQCVCVGRVSVQGCDGGLRSVL